jgi:hypothetical protein
LASFSYFPNRRHFPTFFIKTVLKRATSALAGYCRSCSRLTLGDTPLLSALVEQGRPKLHNAIDQLVERKVLTRKPDDDLQRWGLHEYMKVAAELKIGESGRPELVVRVCIWSFIGSTFWSCRAPADGHKRGC